MAECGKAGKERWDLRGRGLSARAETTADRLRLCSLDVDGVIAVEGETHGFLRWGISAWVMDVGRMFGV